MKDSERSRIMYWAFYMLKLENAVLAVDLDCFTSKPRQNYYGRALTKRLLKTSWLKQEAGGEWCFRKASRQITEPRRAQARGDWPLLPSHTHKMESQLMKEKVYLITWKPSSWLTSVKLVTQNWRISQYFFVLEPLLPQQPGPGDNCAR